MSNDGGLLKVLTPGQHNSSSFWKGGHSSVSYPEVSIVAMTIGYLHGKGYQCPAERVFRDQANKH